MDGPILSLQSTIIWYTQDSLFLNTTYNLVQYIYIFIKLINLIKDVLESILKEDIKSA